MAPWSCCPARLLIFRPASITRRCHPGRGRSSCCAPSRRPWCPAPMRRRPVTGPDPDISALQDAARGARRAIVKAVAHARGGHLGGPLSAVEVLTALYFGVLRIRPEQPDWPDRDRFILSKGHSAIALYAVLALRGLFPVAELSTFDAIDSRLQGHPDMTVLPGLDMSTGSPRPRPAPGGGLPPRARPAGPAFTTFVMVRH